jgi:outer membrane protein
MPPSNDLRKLGSELKLEDPQPADVEKWIADAQLHNIQIVIAQAATELSDKEMSKAMGGHLPTVDLVVNYSRSLESSTVVFGVPGSPFGASDISSRAIGLQLNMPLFQGGVTQSKYREAEAGQ